MSETSTAVAIVLTGGPACGEVILVAAPVRTLLRQVRRREEHAGKSWLETHAYNLTEERNRRGAVVYLHERCVGISSRQDEPGKGGAA